MLYKILNNVVFLYIVKFYHIFYILLYTSLITIWHVFFLLSSHTKRKKEKKKKKKTIKYCHLRDNFFTVSPISFSEFLFTAVL